jgi:hypothetical protein
MPGLSPWKSRDVARPKPNRRTYIPMRSAPTRAPILMAPTLLDFTSTSVNDSGPYRCMSLITRRPKRMSPALTSITSAGLKRRSSSAAEAVTILKVDPGS